MPHIDCGMVAQQPLCSIGIVHAITCLVKTDLGRLQSSTANIYARQVIKAIHNALDLSGVHSLNLLIVLFHVQFNCSIYPSYFLLPNFHSTTKPSVWNSMEAATVYEPLSAEHQTG